MILADIQAVAEATSIVFVDDGVDDLENPMDWQAAYQALQMLVKVLYIYPELTTDYLKIEVDACVCIAVVSPHVGS